MTDRLHPLTDYRRRHGITLEAMGEKLGVAHTSIIRYERGAIPRPKVLARIFEATGGEISANDLVAWAVAA